MKKISIIVPGFNEEAVLPELFRRIASVAPRYFAQPATPGVVVPLQYNLNRWFFFRKND